jgi:D-alanyl-D-alanine carboxypeptidase
MKSASYPVAAAPAARPADTRPWTFSIRPSWRSWLSRAWREARGLGGGRAVAPSVGLVVTTLGERIDALMGEHVTPGGPGAAIGVLRDGAFVHRKAYGLADLEWGTPLSPDCVFRICSLTKQFTAVAVMMLEECGALCLDDPIERWLPDWPPRGRRVTLRQLANHTSGVWRHDSDQVERTLRRNPPVSEVLAMIMARDFEFEPGARHRYNNSSYLLLGAVIEVASGRPYEAFLREAIFEPLGMERTGILTHGTITPRRARGYIKGRSGFHNARLDAMNWSHAAGALGSTLDDLALWDRAIRSGRLIRRETFELMLAPTPTDEDGDYPYGLGWGVAEYLGERVYHHTGGISGFACHMAHLRDEDLTTIVLSNLYLFPFDLVTRGLLRLAKDVGLPSRDLPPPTPAQLAACAGEYRNTDGPFVVSQTGADLATLGEDRLCDRSDPEVEHRFSEMAGGRFQRLDYLSPLWPVTTYRRVGL